MRVTPRRSSRRVVTAAVALGALAASMAPAAGAGPKDGNDKTDKKTADKNDKLESFSSVVGFDYGYKRIPDKVPAGTYDFTFVNTSPTEFHEIVWFKLADDKDKVEDVVAAADAATSEEDPYFSDFRGVSFAPPLGTQEPDELEPGFFAGRADLGDPGRYAYICFIPQNGTGVPHYQLGMVGTVDVP